LDFPSLTFVGSVWSALDDVHSSGFKAVAYECRPFLGEFTGWLETSADCASTVTESTFAVDASLLGKQKLTSSFFVVDEPRSDKDIEPTLSSSLVVSGETRPIDEIQAKATCEVLLNLAPSPKIAPSILCARKIKDLPYLKSRPIGVTGYRFIHLHSFQTGIRRIYRGYSLRFPRIFGKMKSYKAKDVAKLLRIRKNGLEVWASENSVATKQDIANWISEVDRKWLTSTSSFCFPPCCSINW